MILEWMKLGVVAAALSAALLPAVQTNDVSAGEETIVEQYTLESARGTTEAVEVRLTGADTETRQRRYTVYNGDTVLFGTTSARSGLENACVASLTLPSSSGSIRWYDAGAEVWRTAPLRSARVQASCVVVSTQAGEALLYAPRVFEDLGNGTMRWDSSSAGSVQVTPAGEGCRIELIAGRLPAGCRAEYTAVSSAQPLFGWQGEGLSSWTRCTMDNERLWCYDGCYHPSPDNYSPSGPNCYYRIPAGYFCRLVGENAPELRAAEDLMVAMLDVMARQQNELGYFPTLPQSLWLSEDYGIGGGFYDTRFNSDLAEVFYNAAWLGSAEYDAAMGRYFDFYLSYARTHSTQTGQGLLVWDYYHPSASAPVHTALNHHLAETLTLYHWAERLNRPELRELADQMLQGVEETRADWLDGDGNLHYARYPDGSYGGVEYAYLTYNDLYDLRACLQARGRDTSALQFLMDSKLDWMRRNGITDYKK